MFTTSSQLTYLSSSAREFLHAFAAVNTDHLLVVDPAADCFVLLGTSEDTPWL